jgi:type VI secretion system protein ImpK
MSQQSSDYDATVVQLNAPDQEPVHDIPFPAVAVASAHQAPRNILYIAQQTSLEDYTPGLNPLVNSAAHLLLEIVRFRNNHQEDIEELRTRLEAEVRGFEAQALASDIEHSQALAARYVLCTAIDESITTSRMGESGGWSRLALLSTFHNETWGGEKFFQILDRCMQQPARNLYLLEMMYLLLSLGFEGKFRVFDRGPIALESLRDKIYRQIRLLRGEPSPDLCKKVETNTVKDKLYAYIPLWLVACGLIFCLSVTFFGFSLVLGDHAKPVIAELTLHAPKGETLSIRQTRQDALTEQRAQPVPSDTPPIINTNGEPVGKAEERTPSPGGVDAPSPVTQQTPP